METNVKKKLTAREILGKTGPGIIMAAAAVTGFVMEYSRTMVSSVHFIPRASSAMPAFMR